MGMTLIPCGERHTGALVELLTEFQADAYFVSAQQIDEDYVRRIITGEYSECRLFAVADYVISDESGDAVYGRITAMPSVSPAAAEISYIVATAFGGCGIATAAVRAMLHRLAWRGMTLAEAKVAVANEASLAVLRKNMFVEAEKFRHPLYGPSLRMVRPLG